jgi:anti-anti-sigma factor
MNIKLIDHNDIVEMILEGNILQENVAFFKSRIFDLINEGKVNIILNMGNTEYISSLCLAVLIDVKGRLTNLQGDLKIAVVNRLVHNLLEITNLVKKIEIYESIESAIESFKIKNS